MAVRIDPNANPATILTSSSLPFGAKAFLRLAILSIGGGAHLLSVIRILGLYEDMNKPSFLLFKYFRKLQIVLNS
jgi:hypothetical protein